MDWYGRVGVVLLLYFSASTVTLAIYYGSPIRWPIAAVVFWVVALIAMICWVVGRMFVSGRGSS